MNNQTFDLGDELEDTVSGFRGIAVSIHEYLNGCRRITMLPRVKDDNTFQNECTFDEPQLKLIQKGAWTRPVEEPLSVAKLGGTAINPPRTSAR